jgi:hypothetical protein
MPKDLPSPEQLCELPMKARVAFAARCAARVEPLLRSFGFTQEQRNSLDGAISIATAFAANFGEANFKAAAEAAAASVAAANAATNAHASKAAEAAAHAADAAAHAADATAAAAADNAVTNAAAASVAAANAAAETADAARVADDASCVIVRSAIESDFSLLMQKSKTEHWTDGTPVPPIVFGEMWPDKRPKWVEQAQKSDVTTSKDSVEEPSIELWIDPGNASADTLEKFLVTLGELHIAAGGSGLEFKEDGDFILIRELSTA